MRWRVALAGGTLLAVCGCESATRSTLTVATLNIAHGRGLAACQIGLSRATFERNLADVAACMVESRPDVVALQEVDGPSMWSGRFDHFAYLAQATGYPHRKFGAHANFHWWGNTVTYGTALLAARPLTHGDTLAFRTDPLDTKGIVSARVDLDGRPLVVASVHLNSDSADLRLRQAEQVVRHLAARKLPIVLMGDFNCDWTEGDALALIAKRLKLHGWQQGAPDLATYPSTAPDQRVDWILLSNELRFEDYRVLPALVSDHRAVVADVRWVAASFDTRFSIGFSVYASH